MEPYAIENLDRDLKKAAVTLTAHEARFLVDAYYIIQEDRKRSANQVRALGEAGEPHAVLDWFFNQNRRLEGYIKAALDTYSAGKELGEWARLNIGVGPVIAAGLLAHIDIRQAPTAGHIWNFAGLNPDIKWNKGEKRPWNAELKTLCWKLGESFVKVSNKECAYYGAMYANRKAREIAKNEAGDFAKQAAQILIERKIGKTTDAFKHYSAGVLPPAHIHARAKRYTVKRFLSDYQTVGWWLEYRELPPKPYPIAHLEDHTHYRGAPNLHHLPELRAGLQGIGAVFDD